MKPGVLERDRKRVGKKSTDLNFIVKKNPKPSPLHTHGCLSLISNKKYWNCHICNKSSERLIENINENWWYLNSTSVSWMVCHWSKWWDQYCLLTDSVIILTSTANFRIGRRLEHASTNSLWIMQNNKFTFCTQNCFFSRYVGFLH